MVTGSRYARASERKNKSQSLNDALTGALKLIRRDMGDGMARRVAERLSVCSQDMLNAIFEDVVGSTPAPRPKPSAASVRATQHAIELLSQMAPVAGERVTIFLWLPV